MSESAWSRRWREGARTDAIAATASTRCRTRADGVDESSYAIDATRGDRNATQVPFEDHFRMEGAVEVWLNEHVAFMRDCLRGCLAVSYTHLTLPTILLV